MTLWDKKIPGREKGKIQTVEGQRRTWWFLKNKNFISGYK